MGFSVARHTAFPAIRNNSAFKGAQGGTLWDWVVAPTTIDYQVRTNMYRLRANARNLAINNPIVRQYLQLLEQNVIGPNGMRLQAQVRDRDGNLDKAANKTIEAAWLDFWTSPWVDGRMSGVQGEQLLIRSLAVDGEIFIRRVLGSRFRYGMALQMIDPDMVDHTYNRPRSAGQNEIRLGIEVDEFGAAVGIWLWNTSPQDVNSGVARQRTFIPAADIIHIYDPERINQTRGITWLNSVMSTLRHLDGYVEASVVASRTAACAFPVFEQTDQAEVDEDAKDFTLDLNHGTGFTLPAGLKLANWNPNHPHTNFGEFTKDGKRWVSCGFNVSYNALANDLEGVNYSSMRSGLLIERDGWKCHQQMWISRFRMRVFGWFIPAGLLSGDLRLATRDPRNYSAHKWTPRGWPWVDPLKDINSAVIAIESGLGSRTGYLSEQGDDFEEICEQQREDDRIANGLVFSQPKTGKTPTKNNRRLEILSLLLDDEEVDDKRVAALMRLYREGE